MHETSMSSEFLENFFVSSYVNLNAGIMKSLLSSI